MARLKEITLIESKTDRCSSSLVARIDDEGNLVLEGYDTGELVREWWGDSDYEYWLKVADDDKDTVLLWLIKERFKDDSEFKEWLNSKGIPNQFQSWT